MKPFLYAVAITGLVGFISGLIVGYVAPETTQRSDRCINSACDQPCSTRFVRHLGECK